CASAAYRSTKADRGQPKRYCDLRTQWTWLRMLLSHLAGRPLDEAAALARDEMREHCNVVARTLNTARGAYWMLGTGYVDLWIRMHRAEEAAIATVVPAHTHDAIIGALYDQRRLDGSDVPDAALLGKLLDTAIKQLNPSFARTYLPGDGSPSAAGSASTPNGLT